MDLFRTLNKIYTAPDTSWVADVDDSVSPVPLNLMLSYNYKLSHVTTILDKYVFHLAPKNFALLAWSLIQPKYTKMPFSKKIKALEGEKEHYKFLLDKIQKKLEIGNNDWEQCKLYFLADVKEKTKEYLVLYGCTKKEWSSLGIDFDESKEMKVTKIVQGLDKWF